MRTTTETPSTSISASGIHGDCVISFKRLRRNVTAEIEGEQYVSSVDVSFMKYVKNRYSLSRNQMFVLLASPTAYAYAISCKDSYKYDSFFEHVVKKIASDVLLDQVIVNKYPELFDYICLIYLYLNQCIHRSLHYLYT